MPKYTTTVTARMNRVIEFEAPDMEAARKIAIQGTYTFDVPDGWTLESDKADLPLMEVRAE